MFRRLSGVQEAFDLVDVDFLLPVGTMLARVHLGSELHSSLRAAAESRWVGSAPEQVGLTVVSELNVIQKSRCWMYPSVGFCLCECVFWLWFV